MNVQAWVLLLSMIWAQAGPAQASPPTNPQQQQTAPSRTAPGHILRGMVFNIETGSPDPVGNASLLFVTTNSHTSTNSDGEFVISMPDWLQAGEEIQVSVTATAGGKELRLFQPLDGRLRIPRDLSREPVKVEVLPKGSRRFLTDEAIESLIRYANARGQQENMNRPAQVGQFDLAYFLEHWGRDQGLDPAEVADRVRAWADGIGSKPTASLEQKALAEFTRHNFEDAGRMFSEAGDNRMKRLAERHEREKKEDEEETRLAIEDYKQSGEALYNGNHCVQAAGEYQKAIGLTSMKRNAVQWFNLKVLQGRSYECASENGVAGGDSLLEKAVEDFQGALKIPGVTSDREAMAIAQLYLAKALADQSETREGAEGAALLDRSLTLMQSTLQIFKLANDPEMSAYLQSHIGKVFRMQAERSHDAERRSLLQKSHAAYEESLAYYTEKDFPQGWAHIQVARCDELREQAGLEPQKQQDLLDASAQTCRRAVAALGEQHTQEWATAEAILGSVLREQAEAGAKNRKVERLDQAIDAYQHALTVLTRRDSPRLWAGVMANLGVARQKKAEESSGQQRQELLKMSHDAYTSALEVITATEKPRYWATIQLNLGNTLQLQALDAKGDEALSLIRQSVEAYQNALKIRTRERYPEVWASTENLLGIALFQQGSGEPSEKSAHTLAESADAYRNALAVLTQNDFPQVWANIKTNLGETLLKQSKELQDQGPRAKALSEALEAFQNSLQVFDRQHDPEKWAARKVRIGDVLLEQGSPLGGKPDPAILDRALAAYHDALDVYTRQQFANEWASAQVQIANALKAQSEASQGEAARTLLARAIKAYRDGIEAYSKDSAQLRAQVQAQLGNALATQAAGSSPGEAQEQYRQAAQALSSYLEVYPDNIPQIMAMEEGILHDHLFEYEAAFVINERRVKKQPEDLSAEADFVEKHLTTGRYSACVDRSAPLIARLPADSQLRIPVGTLQAACELGAGHGEQAVSTLTALEQKVANLPEQVSQPWSFDGTKHFIESDSVFSPYRAPLLHLLAAVESGKRDSCRAALRALIVSISQRAAAMT